MYKIIDGTTLKIIKEEFKLGEESNYNLRHTPQFTIPHVNSVHHGTESASFWGPNICKLIPSDIKGKVLTRALRKQ